MRKLLVLMFCVFMAMAVAGCGSSDKSADSAAAAKVLKVATDANFPPFEFYQEQSKQHTGFDVELVSAMAKHMGYDKVEFVNVDFKDILTGLNEKKYDVAMRVCPLRQSVSIWWNLPSLM